MPAAPRRRPVPRFPVAAVVFAVAAALTACGNSDPLAGSGHCDADPSRLTVGSANFPESETVADVYAEALRANGFTVDTKPGIGSREAYVPALRQCSVSVLPDYTGNLLRYLDPKATVSAEPEIERALAGALGPDLAVATPAPGQDSDAVVVTRATADRWHLQSIADLAAHSGEVKFAGMAEFQERPDGLPGLKETYHLTISPGAFVPIADGGGPATVRALTSGQVDAADIFTTSPALAANDLVVLADPLHNFSAQNVVPLFNARKKSDRATAVLNAVSAQLTTDQLLALNEAVSGASKTEPAAAAKAWTAAHHLDQPIG
ncbi:ABC transporter substrate-binding protein [Nocardia stercoris]|uniref:ABC transporter substrate-binding protein n=1 Tax=Nocardia stercoris TaxID=2483361 RepID=A0A3M2LEA8_9NOCA|nr:ABC transporter substrate-binding protein [Nocardia stercoris]